MLRSQQMLFFYGVVVAFVVGDLVLAARTDSGLARCRAKPASRVAQVVKGPIKRECRRLPLVQPFQACRYRSEWQLWPPARRLAEKSSGRYQESCNSVPAPVPAKPEPLWGTSYAQAVSKAERQRKMLLIYFCDGQANELCARFKSETLDAAPICEKLKNYVCVQLPLDAKITVRGEPVTLLEHEAFREMEGRPGIAMIDYRSDDEKLHGMVVSTFPLTESLWYSPEQMAVILNLPPGTLTQRTLIYAVRTHPEKPASTESELSPMLSDEAKSQAEYQANIHQQGHQFWESRFQRIIARLPGGLSAREICAESWPHQGLVEAAIECVRCWRTSSGHWSAVRSPNHFFGFDMRLGTNGVWYATGIVSQP